LKDDYAHQGRPITEIMKESDEGLNQLAAVYKQINAPVGQLSLDSVVFATKAINSNTSGDQTYLNADATIAGWNHTRDTLAAKMIVRLDPTAPGSGDEIDDSSVHSLIVQGRALLAQVHAAAS
jgi:hypothetical protein